MSDIFAYTNNSDKVSFEVSKFHHILYNIIFIFRVLVYLEHITSFKTYLNFFQCDFFN